MNSKLSGPPGPHIEQPVPGQPVTVERLRERGVKKRSGPEHGYLVLEQLVITPAIGYRPAGSSAKLYRSPDPMMGGSPPLFDPEIVQWDARGLILQGWEISDGGTQYRQVWLVTFPTQSSGPQIQT